MFSIRVQIPGGSSPKWSKWKYCLHVCMFSIRVQIPGGSSPSQRKSDELSECLFATCVMMKIIRIQSALDFMGTYDQRVQRGGGSFQNGFRSQFTTRPNSSNRNAIGKQGS